MRKNTIKVKRKIKRRSRKINKKKFLGRGNGSSSFTRVTEADSPLPPFVISETESFHFSDGVDNVEAIKPEYVVKPTECYTSEMVDAIGKYDSYPYYWLLINTYLQEFKKNLGQILRMTLNLLDKLMKTNLPHFITN
jgi:hypothetical protein